MRHHVATLSGVLLLFVSGCGCHPDHPPYSWTRTIDVGPAEPCPDRAAAMDRFGGTTRAGDKARSVDSDGVRTQSQPARQRCCYVGRFVTPGGDVVGALCMTAEMTGAGEAPDPLQCPDAEFVKLHPPLVFQHPRTGPLPLGVYPEDVQALSGPPAASAPEPRRDACEYRVTMALADDACS